MTTRAATRILFKRPPVPSLIARERLSPTQHRTGIARKPQAPSTSPGAISTSYRKSSNRSLMEISPCLSSGSKTGILRYARNAERHGIATKLASPTRTRPNSSLSKFHANRVRRPINQKKNALSRISASAGAPLLIRTVQPISFQILEDPPELPKIARFRCAQSKPSAQ